MNALTHVVSDGFAIGEPPGGLAAGVVDAVPGVVGLGQGHGEVVVVPHVRHRVAEHVGHRTLGGGRRRARRRYGEVSRVRSSRIARRRRRSHNDRTMRENGNGEDDGKSCHCCSDL